MSENKIFINNFNKLRLHLEKFFPQGSELTYYKNDAAILSLTHDIKRNELVAILQGKVAIEYFKYIQPVKIYATNRSTLEVTLPNLFFRIKHKDMVYTTTIQ